MKKQIMILTAALIALPAFSRTNEVKRAEGAPRREHREDGGRKGGGGRDGGRKGERRELTSEEQEQVRERRLAMMEKTLKDIGVSEEQQQQIAVLQNQMKEQMRANFILVEENKKKLKVLEETGAPEAEIFTAIDAVTDAQAEQMKILARNRIQMERILGKEKYAQFMDQARNKWKEHGRRGGENLPPVPGSVDDKVPPIPAAQ